MIPLTDEQKDLYDKATNWDWCKKEFSDDYFCSKCYEKLAPAESKQSDNPEIKCHEISWKEISYRNRTKTSKA